jgi:hypothetical protein
MDGRHHDDPLLDVQGVFIGNVVARSDDLYRNEDWDELWTGACKLLKDCSHNMVLIQNRECLPRWPVPGCILFQIKD